jgi:glycosyltransferase involved in cell wall biosynthesis
MSEIKTDDFFIVIPAYNEEKNIESVLRDVISYSKNIIVVDDGSTDNTRQEALKVSPDITVISHKKNSGKGGALRTGCDTALKMGAKILVLVDSDGQHAAADMKKLIDRLVDGKYDIVFGIRKFNENMPFLMKLGNKSLTFLVNYFSHTNLKDTQGGLRCLTAEAYEKIRWQENNYSVETEMILNVGENNLKYDSVGIQTIYRDRYKGTTIIDGLVIFYYLLKWKLRSMIC